MKKYKLIIEHNTDAVLLVRDAVSDQLYYSGDQAVRRVKQKLRGATLLWNKSWYTVVNTVKAQLVLFGSSLKRALELANS